MKTFLQDAKYGLRSLLKSRGFALTAIFTLALGIGANTAIFSVVHAVLVRPLPFQEPDRLVMVWANKERRGGPALEWTNPADLHDWREQNAVFEEIAALGDDADILGEGGEPEQIVCSYVTWPMFAVLKTPPALGRDFREDDDKPNGPRLAILSHGLWQRRFGSDPKIIGRAISLSSEPVTVIGVMPAGFRFPVVPDTEMWRPLQRDPTAHRGGAYLRVIARMKPGVTVGQAQTEMNVITARLEQQYPATNEKLGATVVPLREVFAGSARPALLLLFAAVGLVLLIACANVANLLLARATTRQREFAIRIALGAGRARLVRQVLTESLLISFLGGTLGLLFATWSLDFLVAGLPAGARAFFAVHLDRSVLGFTFAVSVLAPFLCGAMPALQSMRTKVFDRLKEGGRLTGGSAGRMRGALVISEVALSLVLLIGTGLLIRSFSELVRVDSGYDAENLLHARVLLPPTRYTDGQQLHGTFRRMLEEIRGLPGVSSAAATSIAPLSGLDVDTGLRIEGRPEPKIENRVAAWYRSVTPGYFQTMGIRLHRGRVIEERDASDAPLVALINESFVHRYFPGEDPLGQRIILGRRQPRSFEITGIVGNVRNFGLDQVEPPAVYFPYSQVPLWAMTFLIRTSGEPLEFVRSVREEVRKIDPELALANVASMEQIVAGSVADRRWTMSLLGGFSGLAMLLAAIGLYGVMAYSVAQRTQEIGVRMALGAQRSDVMRLVLGDGMRLWALGIAVGVLAALAATRWMSSLLFGVGAADPATFVAAPLLLAGVAVLATVIPARRAMRTDPLVALRYE